MSSGVLHLSKNMHYYHARVIISCWTSRVYSLTTYDYLWNRFRCTAVSVNGWVTNSVFSLSKAGSFAKSKAREQRFTAEIFCVQNLTSDTLLHYSYYITTILLHYNYYICFHCKNIVRIDAFGRHQTIVNDKIDQCTSGWQCNNTNYDVYTQ